MRKLIIILMLLSFIPFVSNGQEFQGKAVYRKIQILDLSKYGKNPDKGLIEEVKRRNKINNERIYELYFNRDKSLYNEAVSLKSQSYDILYKDVRNKKYIKQTEIPGKFFLINDTLPNYKWNLVSETKMIGNFLCQKAIGEYSYIPKTSIRYDDLNKQLDTIPRKAKVVAWYTMDIPVSQGPDVFYGLPGLILSLEVNDYKYLCEEIKLNIRKSKNIKPPKKGEQISNMDFEILRNKKLKERNRQLHGGSNKKSNHN